MIFTSIISAFFATLAMASQGNGTQELKKGIIDIEAGKFYDFQFTGQYSVSPQKFQFTVPDNDAYTLSVTDFFCVGDEFLATVFVPNQPAVTIATSSVVYDNCRTTTTDRLVALEGGEWSSFREPILGLNIGDKVVITIQATKSPSTGGLGSLRIDPIVVG